MTVYLVGAGPGDPGLLTVSGLELLRRADVVVHDRLVDRRTLALVRDGADLVDVGKSPFGGGASQDKINELLIERGRTETVVRLKGGDPYVFGRGGEEAMALEAAGVAYEVVPGVSSIAAVPAAAGIPLTVRGVTSSLVALTGHDPEGTSSVPVDWTALGASEATLVIVMGAARPAELARRLLGHGRAPDTPVAVIERGTTPEQRTRRTTLSLLGALTLESPATIVVGTLARTRLASFEDRPLHGLRVLVTRPAAQAGELAAALSALGARPVLVPTVAIVQAPDGGHALRDALSRLSSFSELTLTSANGVEAVFAHLRDARALAGLRVAAVGPATAAALRASGVVADIVADPPSASGLLGGFPPATSGARVLYPRAAGAGTSLSFGLERLGYLVEAPVAYATVSRALDEAEREAAASADAVVLASGSAARGLVSSLAPDAVAPIVVTIGEETSAAARDAGLVVTAQARTPDTAGMLEALVSCAAKRRDEGAGRQFELG